MRISIRMLFFYFEEKRYMQPKFGIVGKSFGLKFISDQSDLFRNLYPSQSEKSFESRLMQISRKSIRLNPS